MVEGQTIHLFLWRGDRVQSALVVLLMNAGVRAGNEGICVSIKYTTPALLAEALTKICTQPCPTAEKVLTRQQVADSEKWDWILPDDLFLASYASRALALEEAYELCTNLRTPLMRELKLPNPSDR